MGAAPRVTDLFDFRAIMDVVQALLDIWSKSGECVSNAFGDMAISIESARNIAAVGELRSDSRYHLSHGRRYGHNMFIYFAAILSASHQNDRCPKKARITHEAAGVADCTSRVCQDF
jgi:hypothetical protein